MGALQGDLIQFRAQQLGHDSTCLFETLIQIHRRYHRLESCRKNGIPLTASRGLLALAQEDKIPQVQTTGNPCQTVTPYQR